MWFDPRQGLRRWFFAKRSIEDLSIFFGDSEGEVRKNSPILNLQVTRGQMLT